MLLGSRSRKPIAWICRSDSCRNAHILHYEEAVYEGQRKCDICGFTVATGDMWKDHVDFMHHWAKHSSDEKETYFNSFPKSEPTGKPLYGWENRLGRLWDDIRRVEDTLRAFEIQEKRPVEERLAFKMELEKLRSRWMWFEDYMDVLLKKVEG